MLTAQEKSTGKCGVQLAVRELTEEEYPLWDQLVQYSPQRSIFTERWWMDIVTNGGMRLLGCFRKGLLVGGLPIWPCVTLGVRRLRQPPLAPYWGPILREEKPGEKYVTQLSNEFAILRALAKELASWSDVILQFHPSLTNWLPFYWEGYAQSTRYTYRLNDLSDLNQVTGNIHKTNLAAIRTANKHGLKIVDETDIMIPIEMSNLSMKRQKAMASPEIRRFWPKLARAAQERGRLAISAAVDHVGNVHAADALVWDDRVCYSLVGGGVPEYRHTCGGVLVVWHQIQLAAKMGRIFDFEGSMIEPIELFMRRFGGVQCSYMQVSRMKSFRLNLARAVFDKLQWERRNGYPMNGDEKSPTSEGE
ncbi:MAG TPA: GNAT family N-acetyltransferase [Armatimonadota bacterium]